MLTRDKLLGSFERRYKNVPTPIGEARIRNLTEGEKSDFEAGGVTKKGELNLAHVRSQRRRLIAAVLVDDHGQLLLSAADVDRLKEVDAAVTSAIFAEAKGFCGFDDEELETLEKNSVAPPAGDSPTGLPSAGE